jgi:hypothetical protein
MPIDASLLLMQRLSSLRLRVATLIAILAGVGCVHKPPTPIPTPSPKPTPSPSTMKPLAVLGNQFSPPILGSITTHHNWPLLDLDALDKIAAAGLNYTDFRLPFGFDDRANYEAYLRAPSGGLTQVFDLTKFNPAFWGLLHDRVAYAQSKGVYVLVDLIDGWWLKHAELSHQWRKSNNINGVDLGYCSDTQSAPQPIHEAWIRHVVDSVGDQPNVIWQDGNELSFCNPSATWVVVMRAIVQDEEAKRGFVRHIFGSLSENDSIDQKVDFASFHKDAPIAARSYPIQINEFSPKNQSSYLSFLVACKASGITCHYWHDDNPSGGAWDDPAWEAEWTDTMLKMGKPSPPPTCAFPCPSGSECSAFDVCRNCSPQIPGDPLWVGDFGRAVADIQAANPNWFTGEHLINGNAPEPKGNDTRQQFYRAIVDRLAKKGICAVPREDAVEISKDSIHDEEYHVIDFGSGDIDGNDFGFKTRTHNPKPQPTPTPGPSPTPTPTPSPTPTPESCSISRKAVTSWRINIKPHGGQQIDMTPIACGDSPPCDNPDPRQAKCCALSEEQGNQGCHDLLYGSSVWLIPDGVVLFTPPGQSIDTKKVAVTPSGGAVIQVCGSNSTPASCVEVRVQATVPPCQAGGDPLTGGCAHE